MFEAFKYIIDLLMQLWPMRIVWAWQVGLYYVFGKCRGTVTPGVKLIFPYFCDVRCVSIKPEIYTTPLQTITLADRTNLTYSASITVIVTNARLAYNEVGHYTETVVEMAASLLSEGLAEVAVSDIETCPNKLFDQLRYKINIALEPYGLEVTVLRFNNFVRGIRTMRLLMDRAVLTPTSA